MSRVHRVLRVTGGRVAFTNTSRIPDEEIVAEIRALAREIDLDRVVVHVKKAGHYRRTGGYAYPRIPAITNTDGLKRSQWRYLIVVADFGGDHWIGTLAHEAKHVEQFRERLKISELPARAFASWWLRKRTA